MKIVVDGGDKEYCGKLLIIEIISHLVTHYESSPKKATLNESNQI